MTPVSNVCPVPAVLITKTQSHGTCRICGMSLKKGSKSASYITTHNFRVLLEADWAPRVLAKWKWGNSAGIICT